MNASKLYIISYIKDSLLNEINIHMMLKLWLMKLTQRKSLWNGIPDIYICFAEELSIWKDGSWIGTRKVWTKWLMGLLKSLYLLRFIFVIQLTICVFSFSFLFSWFSFARPYCRRSFPVSLFVLKAFLFIEKK